MLPKILLIKPFFGEDPTKTSFQRFNESLALGYLSASLKKSGIEANVIDAQLFSIKNNEFLSFISDNEYPLVAVSCPAQRLYPRVQELAQSIKASWPKTHITVGGHFSTITWSQMLVDTPEIDSILRGEGDIVFPKLVMAVLRGEPLSSLPGLVFRQGGKILENQPPERIRDLDSLPFPDRDYYLPFVLDEVKAGVRPVSLIASRGCWARCSFCSESAFIGKGRTSRSPENIVSEMVDLYKRYDVRRFKFNDQLFIGKGRKEQEWGLELARRIVEQLPGITFWAMIRTDSVDKEVFTQLYRAGLKTVFVGIESGSDEVLDRFQKDETSEENRRAIVTLKEIGIKPELGFIMFEPEQTLDDVRENLKFLRDIGCYTRHNLTNKLNLYHGSKLHQKYGNAEDPIEDRHGYRFRHDDMQKFFDQIHIIKKDYGSVKSLFSDLELQELTHSLELEKNQMIDSNIGSIRSLIDDLKQEESDIYINLFEELCSKQGAGISLSCFHDRQMAFSEKTKVISQSLGKIKKHCLKKHLRRVAGVNSLLINICGIDGAGKTTLMSKLASEIRNNTGKEVIALGKRDLDFSDPIIVKHMETLNSILWYNSYPTSLPTLHWIYMIAGWFWVQHTKRIEPLLNNGAIVITDGAFWKLYARFISKVNPSKNEVQGILQPLIDVNSLGITVLLDVQPNQAFFRKYHQCQKVSLTEKGGMDNINGENDYERFCSYQGRTRATLKGLAKKHNWFTKDCGVQDADALAKSLYQDLEGVVAEEAGGITQPLRN